MESPECTRGTKRTLPRGQALPGSPPSITLCEDDLRHGAEVCVSWGLQHGLRPRGQRARRHIRSKQHAGLLLLPTDSTQHCITSPISPGPLFTGFNQVIRTLPGITTPSKLVFPLSQPADGSARIEFSLDDSLKSPVNYMVNFSIAREFAHGLTIEASYVGRMARNLLAQRDLMMPNNLVDPKSGMDCYTAARLLYDLRWNNVPISQVKPIAYFENLFPSFRRQGLPTATQSVYSWVSRDGVNDPDWTFVQYLLDGSGIYSPAMFYQPQYGALDAWSTVAHSDYHAATLSVRERFKNDLNLDFNYTFSKSIDNASGLQQEDAWSDTMILNAMRPNDNKALSNFDMTHVINANMIWEPSHGPRPPIPWFHRFRCQSVPGRLAVEQHLSL